MDVDQGLIVAALSRAVARYTTAGSPVPQNDLLAAARAAHDPIAAFLEQRDAPYPDDPVLNALFLSFFVETAALAYMVKIVRDGDWPEYDAAFGKIWDTIKDLLDSIGGEPIG